MLESAYADLRSLARDGCRSVLTFLLSAVAASRSLLIGLRVLPLPPVGGLVRFLHLCSSLPAAVRTVSHFLIPGAPAHRRYRVQFSHLRSSAGRRIRSRFQLPCIRLQSPSVPVAAFRSVGRVPARCSLVDFVDLVGLRPLRVLPLLHFLCGCRARSAPVLRSFCFSVLSSRCSVLDRSVRTARSACRRIGTSRAFCIRSGVPRVASVIILSLARASARAVDRLVLRSCSLRLAFPCVVPFKSCAERPVCGRLGWVVVLVV